MAGTTRTFMPPEMYNVPAADGASVLIGTGPYQFAEWVPGDHLLVERFDDYKPVSGEFSFMSGEKVAYFDTVDYVSRAGHQRPHRGAEDR